MTSYATLPGLLLILLQAACIRAQSTSASSPTATTASTLTTVPITSTSTSSSSSVSSTTGSFSVPTTGPDSGPGGSNGSPSQSNLDNSGAVNLYFVFIALILCVAGLGAFYIWRRKRRVRAMMRDSRDNSLARDLSTWDPVRSRRRYWQGRWRSAEVSREEGLNEHGEAPPPYVPKTPNEESSGEPLESAGPAIPLQTLSREQAGLKPPDYSESDVNPVHRAADPPSASGESSSRAAASQPEDAPPSGSQPSSSQPQ